MSTELQRDIEAIDIRIRLDGIKADEEAWQRLKPRLTPDRERVARALYLSSPLAKKLSLGMRDWEQSAEEYKNYWRANADAAIAAMGVGNAGDV